MTYIGSKPADKVLTASDITDGVVSNAKLAQDIISADTALGATPADTDEFLVSDAGTLKRMDYSYIKGGITMADQWRLTSSFTGDAVPIASNWERNDTSPALGYFGSAMTESSGIFTFPSTGIYYVKFHGTFSLDSNSRFDAMKIEVTENNSSYSVDAITYAHISRVDSQETFTSADLDIILDVTDTSNIKVRFSVEHHTAGTSNSGDTTQDGTYVRFIRLGDT